MQEDAPLVSVIMPVYNSAPYLRDAIQSILDQTHQDLEFLIFNDGSKDNSRDIILSFSDPRIQFFDHEINQGYLVHLNKGLSLAKGSYIARMDSDDIANPDRLAKQIVFLEKNPEVDIVGSSIHLFSEEKERIGIWTYPQKDGEFRARLISNTCIAHPTVTFRRKLVDAGLYQYDQEYYPAEDYELWTRLKTAGVRFYTFREPLLKYRISATQIGNNPKQRVSASNGRRKYINSLLSDKTLANWLAEFIESGDVSAYDKKDLQSNLSAVWQQFSKEDADFKDEFARLVFFRLTSKTSRQFRAYSFFRSLSMSKHYQPTLKNTVKMHLRELMM